MLPREVDDAACAVDGKALVNLGRDFFRGIAIVGVVDHGLGGDAGALDDPRAGDDVGASLDVGTPGPVGDLAHHKIVCLRGQRFKGRINSRLHTRPSAAIRYTSDASSNEPAS